MPEGDGHYGEDIMWSKWGERTQGVGAENGGFNFKYGGWKKSSDEPTFEQRLEGEEGEGHVVM